VRLIKALFCIGLVFLPGFVWADDVHEYQLPNGLKLIVKEDHRAPVVISQVWYKVGSSYEHNGITGISHALEHMMFRGTQKYGPGELDRIIAENGGEQNAFTYYDYTAYYQILDASKLPISFELEADRMRGLLLRQEDFNKEIQVVMEERRMRTDDSPQQTTYERFMAAAFASTSYHHSVIGWMHDLKNMKVEDLRHWYQQWYAPNNAIIVVVGDVIPEQVYQLAQKYFGPLKPSVLPTLKPDEEIKPIGLREITVRVPAQLPWLVMGYNVPVVKNNLNSEDPYVLDLITTLLAGGDSARFGKTLIRGQQIAANADASYNLFSRLNNLFILYATPAQGHTVSQVKSALLDQVKQLQTTLVSPEELALAKTRLTANKVYKKDSIEEQASDIGGLEAVGLSWKLNEDYLKHIDAITPQQIQAVAKRYLVPERLTIAILDPLPLPKNYVAPTVQSGDSHVR